MELKDCYKILGVDENASIEEITKKWKELVKQLHPDHYEELPPEAVKTLEDKLKIINEAYNLLKEAYYSNYKSNYNKDFNESQDSKNSYDYSSMVTKSKLYLYSLLEGNKINFEDFNVEGLKSANYKLYIEYNFKFEVYEESLTEVGGPPADVSCDNKLLFENTKKLYLSYANRAQREKEDFINYVLTHAIKVFSENKEYRIWKSPIISYSYDCPECDGRGEVICSRCKGSGYIPCVYCDGRGKIRRGGRFEVCPHCHGRREIICRRCDGRGEVKCNNCLGYGFFTQYYICYLKAEPNRKLEIYNGLRSQEVLNFFISKSNKEIVDIAPTKLVKYKWINSEQCCFYFESSLYVVEEKITIKNKDYIEVLVNDVLGILKPPIFDDIFSDLLKNLQANLKRKNFLIQKNQLIESFNYARSYKTVDSILKQYKNTKDNSFKNKKNYLKELLINKTGGYISEKFSEQLSENLVKMMKILSPHTTLLVWGVAVLISLVLEMLGILLDLPERIYLQGKNYWISFLSIPFCVLVIFILIISPLAVVINKFITQYRQRYIPKEYRSKIYHKKSILISILIIFIFWFIFFGLIKFGKFDNNNIYLNIKKELQSKLQ